MEEMTFNFPPHSEPDWLYPILISPTLLSVTNDTNRKKTLLYKLIQENLLNFYQQMDRDYEKGIPCFVRKEFDEFLKCGVLAHGGLRVQCTSCKHEKLERICRYISRPSLSEQRLSMNSQGKVIYQYDFLPANKLHQQKPLKNQKQ